MLELILSAVGSNYTEGVCLDDRECLLGSKLSAQESIKAATQFFGFHSGSSLGSSGSFQGVQKD